MFSKLAVEEELSLVQSNPYTSLTDFLRKEEFHVYNARDNLAVFAGGGG